VTAAFAEGERPQLSDRGFLVLSAPGSDFPRVRANEELHYQAGRAERGFELLEALAAKLPEPNGGAELVEAVLAAQTQYSEACLSFCDLAPKCHRDAISASDPIVLGDDVRRFVSGLPLARVGQLLDGDAPVDDTERALVERLRAAEDPGWA
jgi:hypothetical protein